MHDRLGLVPRPRDREAGRIVHAVDAKAKARDDSEVAAPAAATGPEEIRVLAAAGGHVAAVGKDDADPAHVVRGQAEPARREAVPAAEREPAYAHRPSAPGRARDPARRRL